MSSQTQFQDIDATQFKELTKDANTQVLDVRTPNEVAGGKISGAAEADIMGGTFPQELNAMDKDKTYLVYCAGGNRSRTACSVMLQNGFTKVYNLAGGIMSWPFEVE